MIRTNRISLKVNGKLLGTVDLDLTQFNNNPEQLKDLAIRAWIEYCVGKVKIEAMNGPMWDDQIEEVCKDTARKIAAQFGWYEGI